MYKFCTRLFRSIVPAVVLLISLCLFAQEAPVSDLAVRTTGAAVPPLIQFSSIATDEGGNSLSGHATLTFSFYSAPIGGEALWSEKQEIDFDATGHYSVQLGLTKASGVPSAIFSNGHARWLGVQVGDQPESVRVLLVSVPYALKAADAQTLGGLPPAAFLRAPDYQNRATGSSAATSHGLKSNTLPPLAGAGTAGQIPLWTPDGDTLGNSILFQSGTGGSAKIGIGNTAPGAKLDVSGGATIRGTLKLASQGNATASAGTNSQPLNLVSSSFRSGSAINQTYVWQAEPTGNNTTSASATLNLLFGSGTNAPAETGILFTSLGTMQITRKGTGMVLTNPDASNLADATTLVVQATGAGATVGTSGIGGSAAGDQGVGVIGSATGSQGVGVNGFAGGANGIAVQGISSNGGMAASFVSKSPNNPTLQIVNNSTGSLIQGFTGSSSSQVQTLNVDPTVFSYTTNSRTTFIGGLGCDAGFVGISFGSSVGCDQFALLGNGGSTILNHSVGGRLDFREGNQTQMVFATGGKLGLGTITPATQLDVIAASGAAHAPIVQFGSPGTTDSNSVRTFNGSGVTEVFVVGKVANFVPGSAAGDGGLRVNPGRVILFGDSGLSRMTIDGSGNVHVAGNLTKGGGSFKIDHPLDPMNKYLYHSFVESPDMMNVYNGNIVTDKRGVATVTLPDYFDALNRDFRYQLTVIGTFAQAIVAHEIEKNRFVIKTSKPGVKVSWQVTGIRQDAYANVHRITVEEEKPETERGTYLHPEAFGVTRQPQDARVSPVDSGAASVSQSRR